MNDDNDSNEEVANNEVANEDDFEEEEEEEEDYDEEEDYCENEYEEIIHMKKSMRKMRRKMFKMRRQMFKMRKEMARMRNDYEGELETDYRNIRILNEKNKQKEEMDKKIIEELEIMKENLGRIQDDKRDVGSIGIFERIKKDPSTYGKIIIKGDSYPGKEEFLPHIIDRYYKGECWTSLDKNGASLKFKFKSGILLKIESYFIGSHGKKTYNNRYHLRNWKIEGKNKGGAWVILDNQINNCALTNDHNENLFNVKHKPIGGVSAIRFVMTGINGDDHNHCILIRNIDFYGEIIISQ